MFFTAGIFSCKKSNLFNGVGKKTIETREISEFDKISAFNDVNVFITQDSFFSVKAEGGKNLLKYVTTEVIDGELQLRNENTMKWMHSYKKAVITIYVTMPVINSIINNGVGEIKSTNILSSNYLNLEARSAGDIFLDLNCGTVWGHTKSSGDVILNGTTSSNVWYCIGYGVLDCRKLVSGYSWIFAGSTGDAYVNVIGLLQGHVKNIGNLYYTGNPNAVEVNTYGKGNFISISQ